MFSSRNQSCRKVAPLHQNDLSSDNAKTRRPIVAGQVPASQPRAPMGSSIPPNAPNNIQLNHCGQMPPFFPPRRSTSDSCVQAPPFAGNSGSNGPETVANYNCNFDQHPLGSAARLYAAERDLELARLNHQLTMRQYEATALSIAMQDSPTMKQPSNLQPTRPGLDQQLHNSYLENNCNDFAQRFPDREERPFPDHRMAIMSTNNQSRLSQGQYNENEQSLSSFSSYILQKTGGAYVPSRDRTAGISYADAGIQRETGIHNPRSHIQQNMRQQKEQEMVNNATGRLPPDWRRISTFSNSINSTSSAASAAALSLQDHDEYDRSVGQMPMQDLLMNPSCQPNSGWLRPKDEADLTSRMPVGKRVSEDVNPEHSSFQNSRSSHSPMNSSPSHLLVDNFKPTPLKKRYKHSHGLSSSGNFVRLPGDDLRMIQAAASNSSYEANQFPTFQGGNIVSPQITPCLDSSDRYEEPLEEREVDFLCRGVSDVSVVINSSVPQLPAPHCPENNKVNRDPRANKLLLAMPEDKNWLSELLCFIRNQIEVFAATPEDVAARSRRGGIKKPILEGRVGIRCVHCADIPPDARSKGAVSYPNSIRIVHQAVRNWQRYHFNTCPYIPPELKEHYRGIKETRAHSGNASLMYWIDSCARLGLVDTDPERGIFFQSAIVNDTTVASSLDEHIAQPIAVCQPSSKEEAFVAGDEMTPSEKVAFMRSNMAELKSSFTSVGSVDTDALSLNENMRLEQTKIEDPDDFPPLQPLLDPNDEKDASPFAFYLISQLHPTRYTLVDRLGKRKYRPLGYPGVECKHCATRVAGLGRYFPLTVTTFANNHNPNNCIHSHVMKCRQCPNDVKERLRRLSEQFSTDGEYLGFGWKKRFFERVWSRLHGSGSSHNETDGVANEHSTPQFQWNTQDLEEDDVGNAAIALSTLNDLPSLKDRTFSPANCAEL